MPTRRIYKFTLCLATPTPCEAMDGGFRCEESPRLAYACCDRFFHEKGAIGVGFGEGSEVSKSGEAEAHNGWRL